MESVWLRSPLTIDNLSQTDSICLKYFDKFNKLKCLKLNYDVMDTKWYLKLSRPAFGMVSK